MSSGVLAARRSSFVLGEVLLVALAGALSVVAFARTASDLRDLGTACAFGVAIALGELLRVTLPNGRDGAPLGAAAALAYALLPYIHGHATEWSPWQVAAVTAVAVVVGAFPHAVARRPVGIDALARRVLVAFLAAVAFDAEPWHSAVIHTDDPAAHPTYRALVLALIAVLASALDGVLAASVRAERERQQFRVVLLDELRATFGVVAAISATGVLVALAASVMGGWALPVFAAPLLLTQFAIRRFSAIRGTYLQTIRSLARVTEVGGYTETGHAQRVSELSVAVGQELGLGESELLDLEYAALMHDIGQLALADPIPGGATVVVSQPEQRRIAGLGADVVRETGVLDTVARYVEHQADPYRRPGVASDEDVPLASRIIRVANAYDDLVGESLERSRRTEALERIRLGVAYDYDPRVVEALARVVERAAG
ncbi:MAG: HD-GYP domain-containing protein [Motilibacteraceae bacterium]